MLSAISKSPILRNADDGHTFYLIDKGLANDRFETIRCIEGNVLPNAGTQEDFPCVGDFKTIIHADYQLKELQGETIGDVELVTGMVETSDGESLPYKVVWKTQKNLSVMVIQIHGEWNTTSMHRITPRWDIVIFQVDEQVINR
ncbi:hypothetical protein [Paenibacillus popilliae]|uniref:hypothetical protein n=1 Tax=Paenibacillus popilliae TaxID=78057 RepID=UPI003F571AE9